MISKLIVLITLSFNLIVYSQWQNDLRLTNDPSASYTSYNNAKCIAANGNEIHIVWFDFRNGNREIYYKRTADSGITWGADTRLTNNSAISDNPSVSISGSVVNVVWEDDRDGNYEIYYKRSSNGGVNWGADTRLSNNSAFSVYPSVAVSGLVVHVVWQDLRDVNDEIYYKRSTDGGVTWGTDRRLTTAVGPSSTPSISVYGTIVHVVWHDDRDGNYDIFYKRSTDGGVTWGADARLTNNIAFSSIPSISVYGTIVHVVWYDERDGNPEIYYKRSTDAGITWDADTRLTNNSVNSYNPSVSVSESVVNVVWYDNRDGNDEIYYKSSTDAGISWGIDTRLTNSAALSYAPSVSVSGTIVHVVWEDNRDGNFEIYYKRDPTGNALPVSMNYFIYHPNKNNVLLHWETSMEINNRGFEIQRKKENEQTYAIIGWVHGNGTTNEIKYYSFSDDKLNSGKYWYRIKQIDYNGNFEYFNLNSVVTIGKPIDFSLSQNYPNPSNPQCKIDYQIPIDGKVILIVYDITGRKIATIINDIKKAGYYITEFDGSNLSSGVYYYKLVSGDYVITKKMIIVK